MLDYWKKKLIEALKIDQVEKSIEDISRLEKSKGYAVGTVRTWSGKDYKKLSSGKWMRTYTGTNERGERQAVRNVMNKIQKASTMAELVDIVRNNRERFVDEDGKQLPVVKEFLDSARGTESGKKKPAVEKETTYIEGDNPSTIENEARKYNSVEEFIKSSTPMTISISKIIPTESHTEENTIGKHEPRNTGEPIRISIDYKGNIHIEDGNHRYFTAKRNGDKTIKAVFGAQLDYKDKLYIARVWERAQKKGADTKKDSLSPIRDKYNSVQKITGDTDEIFVGKEEITGTWKLVEADSPSASHNEKDFSKTEGFPTNKDGSTINDRDYEKDKDAQLSVIDIASEYDGRALSFDSPVIVSPDGVVISGNNRTMSSKIAANKGTDKKYINALKKRAKKFGFTSGDVSKFKNPRVVFEMDNKGNYSTKEFSKFNETSKKTMSPVESAVKMSKIITPDIVKGVAGKIDEFETMGELYADKKAVNDVFRSLEMGGIINQFTRPQYVTEDGITGAGKEFLETVLIGSVVNEKNIRGLSNNKIIRKKLVRAIVPLIENKAMGGYSVSEELNNAIDIHNQVRASKEIDSVTEFAKQSNMFEETNDVSVELAKKMDMKEKDFASFMKEMNGNLEVGASGQADIFFGDVESKSDILNRMLKLGKSIGDRMKYVMRKSKDLNYWKKKLLGILKDQDMEKSLKEILFGKRLIKSKQMNLLKKARGYPAGTIREWSGKKYKKLSSGKWMRAYEGTGSRGEKQAIRNVTSKINKASSMSELAQIVSENMQRFKDSDGKTLPVVKEFLDAARGTEAGKKKTDKPTKQDKPKKAVVKKRESNIIDLPKKEGKPEDKASGKEAKIIDFPEKPKKAEEKPEDNWAVESANEELGLDKKDVAESIRKYKEKYPRRKLNVDKVYEIAIIDETGRVKDALKDKNLSDEDRSELAKIARDLSSAKVFSQVKSAKKRFDKVKGNVSEKPKTDKSSTISFKTERGNPVEIKADGEKINVDIKGAGSGTMVDPMGGIYLGKNGPSVKIKINGNIADVAIPKQDIKKVNDFFKKYKSENSEVNKKIPGHNELKQAYDERSKQLRISGEYEDSLVDTSIASGARGNETESEKKIKDLEKKYPKAKMYIKYSNANPSSSSGSKAWRAAQALLDGKTLEDAEKIAKDY